MCFRADYLPLWGLGWRWGWGFPLLRPAAVAEKVKRVPLAASIQT